MAEGFRGVGKGGVEGGDRVMAVEEGMKGSMVWGWEGRAIGEKGGGDHVMAVGEGSAVGVGHV